MRVLIFGDSITQGFWDTEGGWVERIRKHYDLLQLTDLIGRNDPTIFNLGISADNSKNILDRIESETISRIWDNNLPTVVIQIGVNDSSQDSLAEDETVSLPIDKYEQNLRAIVEKIGPHSSNIIFVGLSAADERQTTPVSWGDFYFRNEYIKKYEDKMKDTSYDLGVKFIPVFDQFLEELDKGVDLLSDGLHPNNEGHRLLSKIIMKELDPVLTK